MGEKTVDLNAGTIYLDDIPLEMTGELTMTTEEECDDTAFPLKLSPSEYVGTINDIYAKGLLLGMIEQIRARAFYIRALAETNNWRKMHGYPMRRRHKTKIQCLRYAIDPWDDFDTYDVLDILRHTINRLRGDDSNE